MTATHIPAWQRLGLKLKNQVNSPSETSSPNTSYAGATPGKRKFADSVETNDDSPLATKKSKKSINGDSHASKPVNGTKLPATTRDTESPDSRRKSVAFTADTKGEDGYSSKRLVQAAYASRLARMSGAEEADIVQADEQLQETPQSATSSSKKSDRLRSGTESKSNGSESTTAPGHSSTEKTPKVKQVKKPGAQPSSKVEAARHKKKKDLALQYLEEYKNSKATWKFNKTRQIAVLKMALDTESIPQTYDEALSLYLEGLQGDNMRRKLRDDAKKLIPDDNDDEDSVLTANASAIARAKLVIDALGPIKEAPPSAKADEADEADREDAALVTSNGNKIPPIVNGHSSKPAQQVNGNSQAPPSGDKKKKRKRRNKKKRTAQDSDSSSSSSSDSDSDSD